jgi:hypothetical protein
MHIRNSDFLISVPHISDQISLMSDILLHFTHLFCGLYIDHATIKIHFPIYATASVL